VAASVFFASAACSLTIGRNAWLSIGFAFLNVGQALLTGWLLEHWFGRTFKLEDVQRVLGFFAATAVGCAIAAVGATVVISLIIPTASPLHVWGLWFAAGSLGVVTVAPLLIGLGDAMRERLPRRELMEGWAGLITLTALTVLLISLPDGPWATALPEALAFPFLLWVAIRCRPVFAAGAALVVGLTVIGSTALNVGNFDSGKPLADRILSAQTFVFIASILAVLLAAVFAERRRSEHATKQVAERLQLALDGVELGAFSLDFVTDRFECDARTAQIHGHKVQPVTMKEMRRFVRRDDLERIDAALAKARRTGGTWNAEYRVVPPPDHAHFGETRWVAVESSIVRNPDGTPAGLLGVTRDITHHKRAENVLAERNAQLALAGRAALVGSYGYDIKGGKMQVSQGYAAIHGLPEGTTETTRRDWRDRVHPDDVERLDGFRGQAFGDRRREYNVEYRIVLPNCGVRWIESRSFISYDVDGNAERVIGVNIDVTERKLRDLALAERNTQLELASKTARIGSYAVDFRTGLVNLSPGCATILGLPESAVEVARDSIAKHVHSEDLAQLEAMRDQAFLKAQREFVVQFRVIRANDGEIRWIEARGRIFYDRSGNPLRLMAVAIDYTERKRAEQALVERNILLALAGRAARVGTFAYDTDKEILQISEDYAAIHGLPEGTAKIARREWLAGVHPEDVERVELPRSEAFREQRNEYSAEFRIIRPGGEVRWVEIRCFITYDGNGHPKRVVGVSTDVTDRKQAELRLAERNAQLDLAGQIARIGTFTYDHATQKLQVSPGFATIYGLPESVLEISREDWRAMVHPDDLPRMDTVARRALTSRETELVLEFRIFRHGEVRWIESRMLISYDDAGKPTRRIGAQIDVTERRRAEDHKGLLVAELDHRVKNTLATVSAVVSQTRQGRRSVAEFAAALEGRLRSMAATHELLSARRWSGVSLANLVLHELAPYANRNNTEINGPDVALRPEAGQAMAMVIHELATNAAKYGALSTRKGRVSIRWDRRLNGLPRSDLVLEWQEIGGPPVSAPGNSGYGTSTIRDLIPYEFGGTVDLVFAPEGVQCRMELATDWLSDTARPSAGAIAGAAAK
jgi:PAS domain S-box-containing protein